MELAVSPPTALRRSESRPDDVGDDSSDADLLVRIADGHVGAFDLLYGRYVRSIFGLALRRLGDRPRAEDAVQETFAAIWRSAKTYRPERGPGAPWLYAVARNAIVDRARGRQEPAGELPDAVSPEATPDERAETAYVSWRVHRALSELPSNERDVLELAYWGGLSQSEVADFLGIPLGTVKTRTRAGLGRLAEMLEGELG